MQASDDNSDDDVSDIAQPYTESGLEIPPIDQEKLIKANILDLRPTQLAVGRQQVQIKAARMAHKQLTEKRKKRDKFLHKHPVPVVLGPTKLSENNTGYAGASAPTWAMYLIDHHHLALALLSQGIIECYCQPVLDCRKLEWMEFWKAMQSKGYVWPYDADGHELDLSSFVSLLPGDVRGLRDDPFRSLSAIVRQSGGYDKVWVPFTEFKWANWLRARVALPADTSPDSAAVVQAALQCACQTDASHLPGFKVP